MKEWEVVLKNKNNDKFTKTVRANGQDQAIENAKTACAWQDGQAVGSLSFVSAKVTNELGSAG